MDWRSVPDKEIYNFKINNYQKKNYNWRRFPGKPSLFLFVLCVRGFIHRNRNSISAVWILCQKVTFFYHDNEVITMNVYWKHKGIDEELLFRRVYLSKKYNSDELTFSGQLTTWSRHGGGESFPYIYARFMMNSALHLHSDIL